MTRTYRLLFLPLFLFLWLVQASEEPIATLEAFDQSQATLQETVIEEGLADAWVETASELNRWKDYSDFLALSQRTLEPTYAAHRPKAVVAELNRRLPLVVGSADWALSFDTGLLAMAAGRYVEAVTCFTEASLDPNNPGNPYTQAYLGRALLNLRNPEVARMSYEQAIDSASDNPPQKFQLSFMYTMDLYDNAQMHVALAEDGPIQACLQSTYPLEKCFALYELLLHAWGAGDQNLVSQYTNDLAGVIPNATPDQNSQYEQRRYKQATELLSRVQAAQQENELARMILDEESCDFDFKTNNHATARNRLKHWVDEYPLSKYEGFDQETKDAVTWIHLNYNVAEVLSGSPSVAETGLETFVDEVPSEDFPRKVVEAWLWLGYARKQLGDLSNAKSAYETGLGLDAVDSPPPEMEAALAEVEPASVEEELPNQNLQPRILAGKIRWQTREDFVKEYHDLLLIMQAEGEQP